MASESLFSGLNRLRKKIQEHRHSGARALPASPESRNTDRSNQWLGLCSWVPGPPLTGRPGMTLEFFSALLRFSILPKAQ
jgi:hypothetical protein